MARKRRPTGKKRKKRKTRVEDYRHEEASRKNIPPAKIAAEGTVPPVPKARYSYDPHLPPMLRFDQHGGPDRLPELIDQATERPLTKDEARVLAEALRNHEPWLEWTGKWEQKGFEVDPVALHIHERVSPEAILKVAARQDVERTLFADPEQEYHEAVQFYRHEIDWTNRLILGDSLQVMSSLARREDLAGKVQMIYIDPPYGIRFSSNFQPQIGDRDVRDRERDLTREPEMVKAYRDTWQLGVHSYLSYLRDRLLVAAELLGASGSVFVQISDENLHRVRQVLDDVFGASNCCGLITFQKTGSLTGQLLGSTVDYLLWYAKDRSVVKYRQLYKERRAGDPSLDRYDRWEWSDGSDRRLTSAEVAAAAQDSDGRRYRYQSLFSDGETGTGSFEFSFAGGEYSCLRGSHWKTNRDGMGRLSSSERIGIEGTRLRYKRYVEDYPVLPMNDRWESVQIGLRREYVVQTATTVIERCVLMTTDPGDLVMDPTCGSGTTAYVAEQWGRRWITIDTSRVAVAIARQRVLTAMFDRYRVKGEDEDGNGNGDIRPGVDPHPGFANKTVPHVTLKSIAQNSNLDPLFENHEPILAERLAACNQALKAVTKDLRRTLQAKLVQKQRAEGKRAITDADQRRWELPDPSRGERFEHWTVPFDTDADWPEDLSQAVTAYRKAWREKMDEVNACIAANADQEELVDQPEVVKGVVRVSGPFTVEAVQPPEMTMDEPEIVEGEFGGAPDELPTMASAEVRTFDETQNVEAYLDQMVRLLRNDGVRFPDNKQMTFSRLDRLESAEPGLHAEGRWVPEDEEDDDPEGRAAVAVAFGPQYGPVTAKMTEDVIRSANRMGYDDLVVAGFSFDGAAQATIEEAEHPRLRIHMANIRPDVNPAMDGLLKEQPGSQLFTVFGQPRTTLDGPNKDGEYTVTMEGVDIYNPVDNTITATRADKVAAWFLDSDYDRRTFCITQAFFPDKKAWTKLSKALKGVIDPDRFEAFSGTTSLPFPPGEHKRVAVKVIDPRGNEVMRVHSMEG